MSRIVAILVLALSAPGVRVEAQLIRDPVVFRSGEWVVRRSVDRLTDAVSCTATPGDSVQIQLTARALYVSLR